MWASAGQGDGSPIGFYEGTGFEQTGDIVFDDEVLLRLGLRERRRETKTYSRLSSANGSPAKPP